MRRVPLSEKIDSPLVMPVQVAAWAFFILPTVRLLVFRITGFAIPLSAQLAVVTLSALAYLLVSRPAFQIPRPTLTGVALLLAAFATYLFAGVSSNTPAALLGTAWIYFVAPCCAMLIGTIVADKTAVRVVPHASEIVERWLTISTLCVLVGITINAADLTLLGDAYFSVYESFGTTAAASFAGLTLPRLAGAYFSGLDLTFAVVLLFVIQSSRGRRFSLVTQLILYTAVLLTFTRNAYVILVLWLVLARISDKNVARFASTAYLLSPLLSLGVMASLAMQAASGQLEPNAETSSLLTRLSSWLTIADAILTNPTASLYGLGLTQNALVPGESDIYAIDNFFWELICYGGAVAFIAYGLLYHTVRQQALAQASAAGRIALMLTALIPIAGIFNNMAGTMLAFALFLCYGLLGAQRTPSVRSG